MSTSNINSIGSYLQAALASALQSTGTTSKTSGSTLAGIDASSLTADNGQLSQFARVLNTLQQLQQSDPAKYKQVTAQIATNLQTAAQTAQSDGNTTAATQLNTLATDFKNASTSGQLPNIQDLAQAVGGHHHHHHHPAADSTDSSSTSATSSSSSTTSSTGNSALDQILAAFQTSSTQNAATDPMSIIMSTLSSSGVGLANS